MPGLTISFRSEKKSTMFGGNAVVVAVPFFEGLVFGFVALKIRRHDSYASSARIALRSLRS